MKTHHTINYIEFGTNDIAAVKSFYNAVFGWKFTDFGSEYTAFSDGSLDGGFALGVKPQSGALVILFSDKLEESLITIEKYGGLITKPIFEFPGGRRFHFKDPVGNELAIWSLV